MGFEFKNRKTTVEVCGKSYVIEKGSVDVAQRVDAMQKRMANMTESELNSATLWARCSARRRRRRSSKGATRTSSTRSSF